MEEKIYGKVKKRKRKLKKAAVATAIAGLVSLGAGVGSYFGLCATDNKIHSYTPKEQIETYREEKLEEITNKFNEGEISAEEYIDEKFYIWNMSNTELMKEIYKNDLGYQALLTTREGLEYTYKLLGMVSGGLIVSSIGLGIGDSAKKKREEQKKIEMIEKLL